MSEPTRELLDLPSKPSILEILQLGSKEQKAKQKQDSRQQPSTASVPRSEVLGKVKNFLGEIAKANEQLAIDAQEKPREEIYLEALTGNEKEYIEMDLLLGVADLNSDEAVAAAESNMCGTQSTVIPVACDSSSDEGGEDESDASDNEEEDSIVNSEKIVKKAENIEPKKKRQKIVVLN
ncbi:hypothetical protein LUZ63_007948 [Rhynchospora breviuscula]|uniref:Uncharacterized protein n=1 Tax=Rhynchospora breviuscula TaxID=2022672 RepID=A0A9Q0CSV2_9POAL|nr:hypothetical protein LUZ63_007948 [Rhynchospora breviuscula]